MFSKNLKKIRSVHNFSQQEFADMFDLKRSTLGAYEEGRSKPKFETATKIANHFGISIEELLTKELTVNRLLKFNEQITTGQPSITSDFESIQCILPEKKKDFIVSFDKGHISLPLIRLPYINAAGKMAFVIDDMTMSGGMNAYLPMDIIIGSYIAPENAATVSGKLAVILTHDDLIFRKMTLKDGIYILTASQPGTAPLSLMPEQVRAVWEIVHWFKHSISSHENDVEQRLDHLEQTLAALEGKGTKRDQEEI